MMLDDAELWAWLTKSRVLTRPVKHASELTCLRPV